MTIGFVDIEGDPRYEPIRAYDRLILKTREAPVRRARRSAWMRPPPLVRVLNTDFALERITVKSPADVAAGRDAGAGREGHSLLPDRRPGGRVQPLAAAVKRRDALLFNVTTPDDSLRRDLCAREFVHVIPSQAHEHGCAAAIPGIAQMARPPGVRGAAAGRCRGRRRRFTHSAQKFGAKIVADQHFKAGTDPREREQNDPALLSAIRGNYDVVFVADDAFDFARTVPYHTVLPRPVVGSIDLEPTAWHWTWEHNGAPQVNSRFEKKTDGRRMDGPDWAAWLSVKMIVQSVLRTRSANSPNSAISSSAPAFDGDKGLPVGIRPWDHQVRQAVLLAAPYQVVASAPMEGFLHRINELDTLGDDEPETPCHLNK